MCDDTKSQLFCNGFFWLEYSDIMKGFFGHMEQFSWQKSDFKKIYRIFFWRKSDTKPAIEYRTIASEPQET
jgi:hypothetical protein